MGLMQKEDYLELGLLYAREGNYRKALRSIHAAMAKYAAQDDPQAAMEGVALEGLPTELLSYYGLCLALVENRIEEGLRFCTRSLELEPLRTDFYLNLGRVQIKADQKLEALKTFRRGLELTEQNNELLKELKKFGIRKKQVFSSLPRSHFLNRVLGVLIHWLRLPRKLEGTKMVGVQANRRGKRRRGR